jgi:uncharacterized protein YqjF (DUF2071 family)
VWFFTLDAAQWAACRFARLVYRLNYMHGRMSVVRHGDEVEYRSNRLDSPAAESQIRCTVGAPLGQPQPGSVEFFLVERYLLYAGHGKSLSTGRVWHEPYRLREANVEQCEQTLVAAAGIGSKPWEHVCFSDAVDVEIFRLNGDHGVSL